MSEDTASMPMDTRVKLSAMMFLQFMLFAAFWVQFSAFMSGGLGFTVRQLTWILGTMAYGCLLSPIIGMIADRHFASQKVLAILNVFSAAFLVAAAYQTTATGMFVFMVFFQLAYMPTWGLTASIAMTHSPADKFPQIRAFGSFGWVAAAIFSLIGGLFGVKVDGTNLTLLCAAVTAMVAALIALTLPHTPPPAKGQESSVIDVLGLKAASLLKQFDFLVFIVIAILVMIPFMLYFNLNSMFLNDMGFKYITFTMNLGQFGEIFFMLLITVALAKMGVKWAMTIGLVAMVVRYAAFWLGSVTDTTFLYYVAIVIHGVIFGFFFVGGQIYVDKKAPSNIRAQAQGFLFLITFGIGALLSMEVNNKLMAAHTDEDKKVPTAFVLPGGAAVTSDLSGMKGAKLTQVRLYDRAINKYEAAILAVDQTTDAGKAKAESLRKEAKADKEKNTEIELKKGRLARDAAVSKAFTFDAKLVMPKDDPDDDADDKLTGTIFTVGSGDNAVTLAVKDNLLTYQAGKGEESKITALRVALPRDKEKEKSIHLAGTFDGKEIKLYVDGGVFEMRNWRPIWGITTICSVVLLVLFVVLFHYKEQEAEEAPAEEPAAEEAPAEEPAAEGPPAFPAEEPPAFPAEEAPAEEPAEEAPAEEAPVAADWADAGAEADAAADTALDEPADTVVDEADEPEAAADTATDAPADEPEAAADTATDAPADEPEPDVAVAKKKKTKKKAKKKKK